MLIQYTGNAQIRVVDNYTWTRQCKVVSVNEKETIQNLITHEGFAVDEQDPLAQLVGVEIAGKLAVDHDICSPLDLNQVKKTEFKTFADALGITQSKFSSWVTSAKDAPPETAVTDILGDPEAAKGG